MKSLLVRFLILILIGVGLVSCFQEIDTVPLEKSTKVVFTSSHSIYNSITFFKIYENITAEVSSEPLGTWDLAFQSAEEGDIVLVNYTVSAEAINTGTSDFSSVDKKMAEDLLQSNDWKFNDPAYSNIRDSTALKGWEDGTVYLINRGDRAVAQEAYYKIQFISKTADSYTFRYAHIESTSPIEKTIDRTQGLVNLYFSFETNDVVDYEPLIGEWNFYFAPYFGWFETLTPGVYSPYYVTGVMINNEGGVKGAQVFDENIAYEDIDLLMAESLEYTDWKGIVGSTWKNIPNPDNPVYTMDTKKKYVLKLVDGNYYKLRFLDFYDPESGEKGYTSFEINLIDNL